MTNLVPIETFRREMTLHPWYFWQLNTLGSTFTDCDQITPEYAYQSDAAGRDDVRRAIETAEGIIREHLGYSIAPHFVTEVQPMPRWYDTRLNRLSYIGADGRWLSVQLNEGMFIKAGVEARALIGTVTTAGGALVFSDADGDGVLDTFTATIATTVTDTTEIEVMFAAADRLDGQAAGEHWRIDPVQVMISGGTATIKGRYWLLVKPVKYQAPIGGDPIDIGTSSNFVTSLEVYRRICDATGTTTDNAQARLIWESRPFPAFSTCWGCGSSVASSDALDPAAYAYAVARVGTRDARRGVVEFGEAVWDAASNAFVAVNLSNCRPPDRIEIRYQAGAGLVNGYIDPQWATVVCRLAAAELGKRVCACTRVNKEMYYWQIDRAFSGSAELERFTMTPEDMNNPIGTRNGHIYAWKMIRAQRQLRGVLG